MALSQPISELRKELQKLVISDLPSGLKLCKELLPENSEKYNLVLQMQANLKQLAKERIQNVITQEENSRRLALITAAFLDFLTDLVDVDFDPPSSKKDKDKSDAQLGSVLYQIPHSMPLNRPSYCKIRVAIEEDAILEDLVIDDDVRVRERMDVSERMSAELVDTEGRVFDILPLNSKDQIIRSTGYTQWLFRVTPLIEGEHQLLVIVSLLAFDQNTKEYVPRDVSVLETVTVVTAARHNEEEEVLLKSTGTSLVLGNNLIDEKKHNEKSKDANEGRTALSVSIRRLSFFLAFLIFTSSVGLSIARPMERDYFIAAFLRQSPKALSIFIEKYQADAPGGINHPLIEKAYYLKAKASRKLADLLEYKKLYPNGLYLSEINKLILSIGEVYEDKKEKESRPEDSNENKNTANKKQNGEGNLGNETKIGNQVQSTLEGQDESKEKPIVAAENLKENQDSAKSQLLDLNNQTTKIKENELIGSDKNKLAPDYSIPMPKLINIKGGTFEMGDVLGDNENADELAHTITVSDFMIGATEVTFDEYDRFCEAIGKEKLKDSGWGRGKRPVINVSWEDAILYCNWLSEKHGLQTVYSGAGNQIVANWGANGYRLPTEAEWEFAARSGGKKTRFANGLNVADPWQINFDGNSSKERPYGMQGLFRGRTTIVGSLNNSNSLGLQDMSGNVSEWCWDQYDKDYYRNSSLKDPKGPAKSSFIRIHRGGAHHYDVTSIRTAFRGGNNYRYRGSDIGFRLVRNR